MSKRDFRDAVFAVVHRLMVADPNVVVLTNDNGAWGLDKIKAEFPERAINVGVAEQNMMSLAGGLASSGKKVFVYGQCAHLMRGWEQIKVGICIPNLPVTILGVGAGLSMGLDGPTHHATEDVALMRVLANMTIYNPADCVCAEAAVASAYMAGTPHYIRMDKEPAQDIYGPAFDFARGYSLFGNGKHPMIIATGIETQRALHAGHQVLDIFRLKPAPMIPDTVLESCHVWDEHHANGGLFSIIAEMLCELPSKTLPDKFLGPETRNPVLGWIDDGYGFPFNG